MYRVSFLVPILALGLAGACSKKTDDKSSAKTTSSESKSGSTEAKKGPLTAAWFGKTVAPPGKLAKLKPGMTKAEAEKVTDVPVAVGTVSGELEDVGYAVQDGVENIEPLVTFPADKEALLVEAWGPGQKADRGGKPVTVWFNPETGTRAALAEEREKQLTLRFEPYMPLTKLLGDGPGIAILDKPFEGKTPDELKALYPNLVTKTGHLGLPSTEWEFGSGVTLSPYPGNDKVKSLAFSIPFKSPEGLAEIMKVIKAKWGEPKGEVAFGSVGGEKTWVYSKKDPHVEVTDPGGYNKDSVTIRVGGGDKK